MAREVRFTALAARDVTSAGDWYEGQRSGLGGELKQIVDRTLGVIRQVPEAGPVVLKDIRRMLLPRFPYALYYRLTDEAIEIRACLHSRRDPKRWRRRA